jgi:CheY-like chemotaxis protein
MLEAAEILNATILIVDDQEANVMLLEQMLRNEGYSNITTTQFPREVHALHQEHRFDLILLDLQMPEMDGFEVIEELKKIEHASYLPVLVITAQPAHKLRALKAGAKDFVSKPFDFVEVQTRIHNMLEVRLLYRRLDEHNRLREARFQRFTELSSDWYWEQDAAGRLTQFSGPVEEMLGIGNSATTDELAAAGWNVHERKALETKILNRQPFLDFIYSRTLPDARIQYLQVSGEPMFDAASTFAGYRGIGLDVSERMQRA